MPWLHLLSVVLLGVGGGWWGLRRVAQDHMQQQGVWEFPLDLSVCVAGSSVYPGSRVSSWLQCGHFSICAPCCGLSTTVGACHLLWARPMCCEHTPPAVGWSHLLWAHTVVFLPLLQGSLCSEGPMRPADHRVLTQGWGRGDRELSLPSIRCQGCPA